MFVSAFRFCLRIWPMILFVLIIFITDFLGSLWIRNARNDVGITLFIGFVFGQLLLNCLIGGCCGKSWLGGVLIATVLSMAGFSLGFMAETLEQFWARGWSSHVWSDLSIVAFMPMLTLAGSLPMLGMRQMFGWTLVISEPQEVPRTRSSLEDILSVTVVTASFLILARVFLHFGIRGQVDGVLQMLAAALFIAVQSLVVALPATWLAFRIERWPVRLAGWLGLCIVGFAMLALLNAIFDPSGNAVRQYYYITIAISTIFATAASGFTLMRFTGVRLTRFSTTAVPNEDTSTELVGFDGMGQRDSRLKLRLVTAGIFSIAVIANMGITALEIHDRKTDAIQDAVARDLIAKGGNLVASGRAVTAVALGKNATDEDFAEFLRYNSIRKLSLADSKVSNASLKRLSAFPNLLTLDLSGTQLDDESLISLRHLNRLSLARTHVSPEAVSKYIGNQHWVLQELDLSEVNLTDEDLEMLGSLNPPNTPAPITPAPPFIPLPKRLILSRNPISDKGIRSLKDHTFERLDLSKTDIDGSGLRPDLAIHYVLDGTKVTDATVLPLLKGGTVVSLKDTAVTATVLGAGENGFVLANCGIKESDLEGCGPLRFRLLHLAGKEFTGTCFRNAMLQVDTVDMSHSGITDETVQYLGNLSRTRHINLSNTALTDKSLPILSRLNAQELDLRHTQITAAGLKKTQFTSIYRVILSRSQFSFSECQSLQNMGRFVFDEDPHQYGQ